MAGFVDVIFRVNNAQVKTGFEQVKQRAVALRRDITAQFTGLFAFGAIAATLKSVAGEFDRVQKLGQRFGESAETIQRVAQASSLAGADIEKVATAIGKATKSAAEASGGNEKLNASFKALGIDAARFANMPLEEKLLALSQGFTDVEGRGDRLRLAIEVLGRSGAEMLPLLLEGPTALKDSMESAAVATQRTIDKMAELNDRMEVVGRTIRVWIGEIFIWIFDRIDDASNAVGDFAVLAQGAVEAIGKSFAKVKAGDFAGAGQAFKDSMNATVEDAQEGVRLREFRRDKEAKAAPRGEPAPIDLPEEDPEVPSPSPVASADLAAQAEARRADDERLNREQTMLNLRQRLAEQEFEKLSAEQQLLTLANEAANLMVDRGDTEEETLRRQIRLNEVAVEMSRLQADKENAAAARTTDAFNSRRDSQGFASGQSASSIPRGLVGVNYSVINAEAAKEVALQQEMRNYLRSIDDKKWAVELPEAS